MSLLVQHYPYKKDNSNTNIVVIKFIFILFSAFITCTCTHTYAQQSSKCTRILQLAQSVYKKGDLYKIPNLLKGCLNTKGKDGFIKQKKIDALKLLTLVRIYNEEPEKADEAMLRLLRSDHSFKIQESVDSEEFILLYNTFRTWSLFSLGLKVGFNYVFPMVNKTFYVTTTGAPKNKGVYSLTPSIQVGFSFETPMFRQPNGKFKWAGVAELFYINNTFLYKNSAITDHEQNNVSNSKNEAQFTQEKIALNLIMHYKMKEESKTHPYIGLGSSISYLIASRAQLETQVFSTSNVTTGPPEDFTSNFNPINLDLIACLGMTFKSSNVLITAELRYQHGLVNISNRKQRINIKTAFDYGFLLNDFTQNSIMLNLGFAIPYFSPKKYLKNK